MKEYKTKKEIEKRLEKLDQIETHIWFSADLLTTEDWEMLRKVKLERAELKKIIEQKSTISLA